MMSFGKRLVWQKMMAPFVRPKTNQRNIGQGFHHWSRYVKPFHGSDGHGRYNAL